jgi:hypothetical protein
MTKSRKGDVNNGIPGSRVAFVFLLPGKMNARIATLLNCHIICSSLPRKKKDTWHTEHNQLDHTLSSSTSKCRQHRQVRILNDP